MPPLVLGLTLLFWGWQAGLWFLAIPFAIAVEAARWWPARWDFGDDDFGNMFNFCFMLLLIIAVYFLVTARNLTSFYLFIRFQPIFWLLLLTTQLYSNRQQIPALALFPFLVTDSALPRTPPRPSATPPQSPPPTNIPSPSPPAPDIQSKPPFLVDLRYLYFGLCILAASAGNQPGFGFFFGMVGLTIGVLWSGRSRRVGSLRWCILMLLAASLGFGGQLLLHETHLAIERQVTNWLSDYYRQDADPYQRDTAIGELGSLKLSNSIAFRVDADPKERVPKLLREATYNRYQSPTWVAFSSDFTPIPQQSLGHQNNPQDNGQDHNKIRDQNSNPWVIAPSAAPTLAETPNWLTITSTLTQGRGLLKLPHGATLLHPLAVKVAERSPFGTVRVEGTAGGLTYGVAFEPSTTFDAPPIEADLEVPATERSALAPIAQTLNLSQQDPSQIPELVTQYFQNNYQYSLDWLNANPDESPLSTFLTETKAGHCEYFATAATLLLREAGIPARYAIGFSVHEYSNLEQQYLVRARHAHAWTLAYLNNRWQVIDPTPGEWIQAENRLAPPWAFLGDWFAFAGFRGSQLWQEITGARLRDYWWVLMIPLVIILFRQLDFQKQVQRVTANQAPIAPPIDRRPGLDSELYAIEAALTQEGLDRKPWETLGQWLLRLQALPTEETQLPSHLASLQPILALHYRYRFDPQGLTADEREHLRHLSTTWLQQFQTQAIPAQPKPHPAEAQA
ncbi:MAG: DUF4129 domain-containing transglutaminase family protein [Prochlorothrix sp.]